MKPKSRNLTLTAVVGLAISAHAAPVLFPNGDFETIDGDQWGEASDGAQAFNYPTTGGNPGGYGQIVSSGGGGYAVLISNNNAPLPLSSLGLTAGETYTFSYDMISSTIGANKGGIKVESWTAGGFLSDSGDQRVTTTTTGWESYTLNYPINPAATHIKIVPLWTPNETVGFDNIGVNNTPIPPPPFVPDQIINGDFETPGGAGWGTTQTTPSYPTTGGNPDSGGHVVLDSSVGSFAVLYAFNNTEKTFASLGLAPGDIYTFQMDMKLISGLFNGRLRLEGPAGFVQEYAPTVIGNGSEWATYSIELTVPASPAQTKFGIRAEGCVMAFDNVSISVPQQTPFVAELKKGTVVSWEPSGLDFSYQAQKSSDNETWTDFGPLVTGDEVNSVFDAEGAAFYQVVESPLNSFELVTDSGFEESSETWSLLGTDPPMLVDDSALAHEGDFSMRMAADNGGVASPKTSILQQSGLGILETDVLDFTFWAKIESRMEANMFYSLKWRDEMGAVIGQVDGSMNTLPVGVWTKISVLGLLPPPLTNTAFLEFGCVTGEVGDHQGSILIDDVSLITPEPGEPQSISATQAPGVEISWATKNGSTYQAKSSTSLSDFMNFGPVINGDGGTASVFEVLTPPAKFYQVVETP